MRQLASVLALALLLPGIGRAQETAATPTLTVEAARPLPEALRKPLPESLDDLRTIESRVRELVGQLRAATVAVQIGAAQGSGVIVGDEGYVLTAAHVSGPPGRRALVVLPDGRRLQGITKGRDRETDAGLIQITELGRWPSVKVGEMRSVAPGDWVIATGHPGGFDDARTPVVRLGRVIQKMRSVIQTDCTLVGGDSGGPLFDLNGRVIGIHSRIGPATAYNFHVPISEFTRHWERMVASEDYPVEEPRPGGPQLGVDGEDAGTGCRLTKIWDSLPADVAGLRKGDIVVEVDDEPIDGMKRLIAVVNRHEPGDRLQLRCRRNGRAFTVTVKLAARPKAEEQ